MWVQTHNTGRCSVLFWSCDIFILQAFSVPSVIFSAVLVTAITTIMHCIPHLQAFSAYDLSVMSSAVLTHAFLTALERVATYFMTRNLADPLETHRRDGDWLQDDSAELGSKSDSNIQTADLGSGTAIACTAGCSPRSLRSKRRPVAFEGAPTFGVFGWLEYVLVFVGE